MLSSLNQSDKMVSKNRRSEANCAQVTRCLHIGAESRTDINALTKYFSSFKALILLATWFKILQTIDYRSKVLQLRDSTIDEEVRNLQSLLDDLQHLRNNWDGIYNEASL